MAIVPLKNKHLSAFTRAIRALKPADIENVAQLPDAEFYDVACHAALQAGWLNGMTAEAVEELSYAEAAALATEIWQAWQEARAVDPN